MSDPVIELKGLKKDYGNGRGVFDVSFSVERGEVFGFLGPNGAGKTVTMRNLMGFIRPDEGTVSIDGLNCFSQRSRIQERLGYLPGEIACMDEMTGAAFLEFMARMKKLRDRTRMNQLVEYFELDPAPVSYTHLTLPTNREVENSVVAGALKKKKQEEYA